MTGAGTGEGGRPEYRQFLPVNWRDHADMRAAVEDRCTVARLAGLRFLVERVELRWTAASGAPLPLGPGRLAFRPVHDDDQVLAVVRGTLDGTLDAHVRRDVARLGVDTAARAIVEELPGPRSLVRLAYDPAGSCVGITVPALGPWGPDIAYVGVLPEHRGTATPTSCCSRRATCSSRVEPPRSRPRPTSATHRWRRRSPAAGSRSSTG